MIKTGESRPQNSLTRLDPRIETGLLGLIFAYFAWVLSTPLRSHQPYTLFAADDAFYYLQIARNMATGHGSTFNGIVPTNGYHPLWLLVLTVVNVISTKPMVSMAFICLSAWVATLVTYLLSKALFRSFGVDGLLGSGIALLASIFGLQLYACGMEVTLTIPLALAFMLACQRLEGDYSTRQAAAIGFLASMVILSRLDTVIWIGILGLIMLADPEYRSKMKGGRWLGFGIGFLPIVAFLLIQKAAFGTWSPVSGQAKQLKPFHFDLSHLCYFYRPSEKDLVYPLILALVVMCGFILPKWKETPRFVRTVLLPTVAYPLIYYVILASVSDWHLWAWYLYPYPAALIAIGIWAAGFQWPKLNTVPVLGPVLFVLMALGSFAQKWLAVEHEMSYAATRLVEFSRTHPGLYAMGDRAGKVGYVLPDPIVQTEGLVMDLKFLKPIKERENLRQLLSDYGVRYFISSTTIPFNGIFHAKEPNQAGKDSPTMQADFPEEPILKFKVGDWYTRVYDLGPKKP